MPSNLDTAKQLLLQHLSRTHSTTEGAFARLRVESGRMVFFATVCVFFGLAFHITSGWPGILALALSIIPAVPVALVGLWLDRNEPEPAWLLFRSFLWGAGIATIISGVVNSAVTAVAGPDAAVLVSAPVVEEAAKGFALLWLLRRHREHLNSRLDAAIYALFIGLGFALVENVDYYWLALQEGGLATLAGVALLRGVAFPFVHPLCTLSTALGVVAGVRHRGMGRWMLPLLGYLGAVVLHSLGNSGAGPLLYLPGGVPLFIWVARRVSRASRREGELVRNALLSAIASGGLPPSLANGALISKWTGLGEWIAAARDPFHPLHQGWRIRRLVWLMASDESAQQMADESGANIDCHLIQQAARELIAEQVKWSTPPADQSPRTVDLPSPPPIPTH
jgi:RsiW-degrading membrane proteinase PrsW (M82 family)